MAVAPLGVGQYAPSSSYSVASLAEASEMISEVEELKAVRNRVLLGFRAMKACQFEDAQRYFDEALEIEEGSVEALYGRSLVFVKCGKFILAQHDADKVIFLDPSNFKGHYVQALALGGLGYHRESLMAHLKAMNLDHNSSHTDKLTNHIADMAHLYCPMPEELVDRFGGMDSYKKLSEVGACLFNSKKYDLSIKVLMAAQKLATNQQGIHMKVQLTLANAHAALKNNDQAISCYQECLSTASASHDHHYQTKSLVSIASLFLEMADTHHAIVYYEKLLSLRREIQGEDENGPLPDYWTDELQCALHLNLSIAYKSISSHDKAIGHALKYLEMVSGKPAKISAEAQANHNIGVLYEVVGKYQEALARFKQYQLLCRSSGNKRGLAIAYGCLGSIYGRLKNVQLCKTYHEQHVKLATSLSDPKMVVMAHEQTGDSFMLLKMNDEASEAFAQMFKACSRNDIQGQATALFKLGRTYEADRRYQYAGYYTSEARTLAEEFKLQNVVQICDFELACIYQQSTQVFELEEAKKIFQKLLPMFEAKLAQHREENTPCPAELRHQIQRCYAGMQNVLVKLGKDKECLLFAEAYKSKHAYSQGSSQLQSLARNIANWKQGLLDLWSIDRVERVVSQQTSLILYYSVIPSAILLWVIEPRAGITRFYSRKADPSNPIDAQIKALGGQMKIGCQDKHLQFEAEHRALTADGSDLKYIQRQNEKLGQREGKEEYLAELHHQVAQQEDDLVKDKPPERRLFDLLVAPISDILCQLEDGSPVTIVPDGVLQTCPFHAFQDWSKSKLGEKYRLSVIPSLTLLNRVIMNGNIYREQLAELDVKRTKLHHGGIHHNAQPEEPDRPTQERRVKISMQKDSKNDENLIILKQTSNPRLATSLGISNKDSPKTSDLLALTKEATFNSVRSLTTRTAKIQVSPDGQMGSNEANRFTSGDRMAGKHSMTTLTSQTATGGDIIQSNINVPTFKQISGHQRSLVIGSPVFPEKVMLHGKPWKPVSQLEASQNECIRVSEVMDAEAVLGKDATKTRFLQELKSASLLHIATLGCLEEGTLAFTPDVNAVSEGPSPEEDYIVTCNEIIETGTLAQVVVLSAGWNIYDSKSSSCERMVLHSAFLQAGAQCVISLLWPIPSMALNKFYFHFYKELLSGCYVTEAVTKATSVLKDDDRFADISYQAPFSVMGKDLTLDLTQFHHASLDQLVDKVEEKSLRESGKNPLNPPDILPEQQNREILLEKLQCCMSQLITNHSHDPDAITRLLDLLDAAIKRLHNRPKRQTTTKLHQDVCDSEASMKFLKLLGFHFQANGAVVTDPYVVFPHWNPDEVLIPAYEALKALTDILNDKALCRVVEKVLPLSQDLISSLVDVLCLTRHAGEVQLKVTDLTVKPLWQRRGTRQLLMAAGFHQIGVLLSFNSIPTNRKLLMALLQMLIGCSVHKSSILLHKLDVSLLGGPRTDKVMTAASDIRLPSLTPLLLPRNQLRMSTPWLSHLETQHEMKNKVKVAQTKSDVTSDYQHHMFRAKTWHEATVASQADESLDKLTRPRTTPQKVKVIVGSGPSCPTVPVDQEEKLSLPQTDERRDYAHYVLSSRLDDVSNRHKSDVQQIFLPYIKS